MNPSFIIGLLMSLSTPVENNVNVLQCETPCLAAVKRPIVIEVNEFTEESAKAFEMEMNAAQRTGQTIIPIVIDSWGGSVIALTRMINVIQSSKVPIATIVEGKAMSAGAVLFTMGKEGYRFAGPHSTILIHQVSGGTEGKVSDMKVSIEEAQRLNDLMFTVMAKNTGHRVDFFTKIVKERGHTDWYIPMDEAKKLNIVNKIGVPEFRTKINVEYVLE